MTDEHDELELDEDARFKPDPYADADDDKARRMGQLREEEGRAGWVRVGDRSPALGDEGEEVFRSMGMSDEAARVASHGRGKDRFATDKGRRALGDRAARAAEHSETFNELLERQRGD